MAKKIVRTSKFVKGKIYWHREYPNNLVKFKVVDISGDFLYWEKIDGRKVISSGKNKIKVFPDGCEYIKPRNQFAICLPMPTVR